MRARTLRLGLSIPLFPAIFAGCNAIFGIVPGQDESSCLPARTEPCAASLTDPENCCTAGRSCQGGSCQNGECGPVLVSKETGESVVDVIVVGDQVIWSSGTTGNLYAMPFVGGTKQVLGSIAGTGLGEIGDLATDGTYVYFTDTQTPAVGRIPVAGGKAEVVATFPAADVLAAGEPLEIAVGGGNVYWAASGKGAMFAPLRGPFPAKALVFHSAVNTYAVSADDTYVYVADAGGGSIYRLEHGKVGKGIAGQALAETCGSIGYITNDSGSVVWAEDNTVKLVPKAGGKAITLAAEIAFTAAPNYIHADGHDVYWTTLVVPCSVGTAAVRRTAESGGGAVVTLATNTTLMDGIAGSCDTVFWLDDEKTSLMKATK